MTTEVTPGKVRYIKLGRAGMWETESIRDGLMRFGFDSASADRFHLCAAGRWNDLFQLFVDEGRDRGTATNFANQTKQFFEDSGTTLWLTFVGELLYWGFLDPAPARPHKDGDGVYRRVKSGWRCTDIFGEPLTKDRLAGSVTKLAAFRGTSCAVDMSSYIVDRINGRKREEVERAIQAIEEVKDSIFGLLKLLGPKDFELLVDLVFSTSGWRRQGEVGRARRTVDISMTLPSTKEQAFVQVKSSTTSAELASYVARFSEAGPFERMFYVFHSGEAETDDERVILIGPERLAEMVVDAGLTNWLVNKVS